MKIDSDLERLATKVLFESDEERQLFSSKTFRTRICFREDSNTVGQLSINMGKNYGYNLNLRKVTFPWDGSNLKRDSYYFRFAFDMNSVENGNLPLHCGAISVNKRGIFVLGESKSGKSLTLDNLASMNFGEIVGDDHVIVRDPSMAGNELIGFRKRESEIKSYRNSKDGVHFFNDYTIVVIDVKKDRQITAEREVVEEGLITDETLKYFLSRPLESRFASAIDTKEIKGLQQNYLEMFKRFVNNASFIYKINGEPDYVTNKLVEVCSK